MASELRDRTIHSNSKVSQTTLSTKTPGAAGSSVAERARMKKSADPVCIDMPVRVRGIGGLPIGGTSEIGQDFTEETRTLIVMPAGAVVRMATRVKKGQLLGLKHLRTEMEVSCRVVNVRSSGTPEDYVEVEFTQRSTGFWGIHFPNDPLREDAPVVDAAPSPGEKEADRVIFGGGHEERGNRNAGASPAVTPATEANANRKAGVKIGADRGSSLFADMKPAEPMKTAPLEAPGFSGLSKSAEQGTEAGSGASHAAQSSSEQTNLIPFPGPMEHHEQASIFSAPEHETEGPPAFEVSRLDDAGADPRVSVADAAVEHDAISKAIEESAKRGNAEAEQRRLERADAGKIATERAAAEKAAAERLAAAHAEFGRIEAEKFAEGDRKAAELIAAQAAAEKATAEKAAAEKAAAVKAAAEKAAAQKAAADKAAAEKAARERIVEERLEFERKEAERHGAERIAAAERARAFAEGQKKLEAEHLPAEPAAHARSYSDAAAAPSDDVNLRDVEALGETEISPKLRDRPAARAARKSSRRTAVGAVMFGTLEEEIQKDRAAIKTAKGSRGYLIGMAAAAVIALLVAGGWWYVRSSLKTDVARAAARSSLPSNGTPNAAAPVGGSNGRAANSANGANTAPGTSSVTATVSASSSAGSSAAAEKGQPVKPTADNKKPDNKKTESAPDNGASAAAPETQPAKPLLKATLSAPVVVNRNSSAGEDVAAPNIGAGPVNKGAAPLIGGVSTTSAAPAPPPTGGRAVPPRLLKSVAAEYPVLARQRRIEGDVVIEANVDVNGNVTSTKVISGSELLREAAANSVRQFKYSPAELNGSPMTAQVMVTVRFRSK